MKFAWRLTKLAVTGVLLTLVGFIFVSDPRAGLGHRDIGFGFVVFFLAILPWVDFSRASRALGLVGVMFSLGAFFVAWETASGARTYPQSCIRRRLLCDVDNLLYAIGGASFPALAFAATGVFLLWVSCRFLLWQRHRFRAER